MFFKKNDDRMFPIEGAPRRKRTNFFTFPSLQKLHQNAKLNDGDNDEVFSPEPSSGESIDLDISPLTPPDGSDDYSDVEDGGAEEGDSDPPIKPVRAARLGERCCAGLKRTSSTSTASTSSGSNDGGDCNYYAPPAKKPAPIHGNPLGGKRRPELDLSPKIENRSDSSSRESTTSSDSWDYVNNKDNPSRGQGNENPSASDSLGALQAACIHQDHAMPTTPPVKGGEDYPWPWN